VTQKKEAMRIMTNVHRDQEHPYAPALNKHRAGSLSEVRGKERQHMLYKDNEKRKERNLQMV
jgi:hypothetical protein